MEKVQSGEVETEALRRQVGELLGTPCSGCREPLCGHEALANLALGFQNAPRCLTCLAVALEKPVEQLAPWLHSFLQARDCHREAWAWASGREGAGETSCRFAGPLQAAVAAPPPDPATTLKQRFGAGERFDVEWDAGHMACGELVLELRSRLHLLPPGHILKLRALDQGVPQDLPAWCGLTGHTLLRARHPYYWIQRKD